jgi:superfamily II RNA helicase
MYPVVNLLTGPAEDIENPPIEFPFPCDDFQKHAFKSIKEGRNVLACAPTASGKTLIAQYAIFHTIKNLKKRVVLTTPIKTLSNQAYTDLKEIMAPCGLTTGISTGDIKIDENSQCLVATAEILRNSMYQCQSDQYIEDDSKKKINKAFIESIGCIIIDEMHYINDEERGQVWEEMIILAELGIPLVMLSATLSEPEHFARWISRCREGPVDLITVEKRKVPLKHYFLINNSQIDALESPKSLHQIMDENNVYFTDAFYNAKKAHEKWVKEKQKKGKSTDNPNNIPSTVRWLRDNNMLTAIFFAFSQKECEAHAKSIEFNLVEHEERFKIEQIFDSIMQPYKSIYEGVQQVIDVKTVLIKGIAYHHAGMFPILKEIIEKIYKEGLVKVLFCTETFAVGVNGPARTVVFTAIEKYDKHGKILVPPASYKQMAGRAGRRGMDIVGYVIILFKREYPDESDIKSILLGKIPKITSHFKLDYQFYLRVTQSNVTNLERFFRKSLANEENETILIGLKKEKLTLESSLDIASQQISIISNPILTQVKPNIKFDLMASVKPNIKFDLMASVNLLIEFENRTSSEIFGGIRVSLPKKQQQEFTKLSKQLESDKGFKSVYDIVKKKYNLARDLQRNSKQITSYEHYVGDRCGQIKRVLYKWGYLTNINKDQLTKADVSMKGVIAGNINECNPIILTEMICGNYFDGLSIEEIISFVSLVANPIKTTSKLETDTLELGKFTGTPLLKDKINNLFNEILQKQTDEDSEFGTGFGIANWKITTDYIDISYNWACGAKVGEILAEVSDAEEREGNFVKNMLKISNIVNDIKTACKIVGKIELLPILEQSDLLIVRDIVTITSLHLK